MSLIRLEVESLTIQNPTNVAQLVSVKSVAKSGLLSQTGHEAVAIIVKRSQNPRARLFWIVYDCRGNWIRNHFSCTHSPLSQSVFKALGFEKIIPKVSIRNQNIATYWNLGAGGYMKCGEFATEERAAHCQLQIAMKVHKVSRKWKWMVRKTRQCKHCGFSIYIFDNSKSKSMVRLVRAEMKVWSGLVFARKIARMILIQNV